MVQKNSLLFWPICRYFERIFGVSSDNYIHFWKSKGLSDENTTPHFLSDYSLTPKLSYFSTKTTVLN